MPIYSVIRSPLYDAIISYTDHHVNIAVGGGGSPRREQISDPLYHDHSTYTCSKYRSIDHVWRLVGVKLAGCIVTGRRGNGENWSTWWRSQFAKTSVCCGRRSTVGRHGRVTVGQSDRHRVQGHSDSSRTHRPPPPHSLTSIPSPLPKIIASSLQHDAVWRVIIRPTSNETLTTRRSAIAN